MATNSQPQETPEYQTFREHYARLVHAIQNPLSLATQLFTRNIIDSSLLQQMNTLGFTIFQNANTLLTAVLGKIKTDPRTLRVFLSALNEDPSMQSLVESIQSKSRLIHIIGYQCVRTKLVMRQMSVLWTVDRAGRIRYLLSWLHVYRLVCPQHLSIPSFPRTSPVSFLLGYPPF